MTLEMSSVLVLSFFERGFVKFVRRFFDTFAGDCCWDFHDSVSCFIGWKFCSWSIFSCRRSLFLFSLDLSLIFQVGFLSVLNFMYWNDLWIWKYCLVCFFIAFIPLLKDHILVVWNLWVRWSRCLLWSIFLDYFWFFGYLRLNFFLGNDKMELMERGFTPLQWVSLIFCNFIGLVAEF